MKRTIAKSWSIVARDETGTIVNIDYTCPCCHYEIGELITLTGREAGEVDYGFEATLACNICGEESIIECE